MRALARSPRRIRAPRPAPRAGAGAELDPGPPFARLAAPSAAASPPGTTRRSAPARPVPGTPAPLSSPPDEPPRRRAATLAVHAGEPRPAIADAIGTPLFPSSTYLLGEPESFDDIRYVRLNNTPNQRFVGEKLAALEGSEAALVTPSGTAAISLALEAALEPGDHVVTMDVLYGGTRKIFDRLLGRWGVTASYVPADDLDAWARAIRPETRVLYTESIVNPTLDVPPLAELAALARARGLVSMIDNTLCSPAAYRPIEHGFDVVLHSASKYLNGHTDVVAGVVAGGADRVEAVRKYANLAGVCLDPHGCHLLHRGIKTLTLRYPAQARNALALAERLAAHPGVAAVRYPGLPEDPAHDRARRWFDAFGAMVSFVPRGGVAAADRLLERVTIPQIAPSLGGVETLISRPATTSHAGLDPAVRDAMGVPDDMVRVAVGIEDPDDLIEDFERALAG